MTESSKTLSAEPEETTKILTPQAKRALAEAKLRREAVETAEKLANELGGPKGLEPTRYGDWERRGIAYDF